MKGKLFDVQIAHYLLHPDKRNSLDIISENYLGTILKEKSTVLGKGRKKILFSLMIIMASVISPACWDQCE